MKVNFNSEVPVIAQADVLIVGGGPAGIGAAIAAARQGVTTILVEAHGFLGGMATAGLVGPFMTSYSPDGERQVIKGVFEEIVRRMEKKGGAIHPENVRAGQSYSSYISRGHDRVGPFDSECLKLTAEELCIEAGVKLIYHAFLVDIIKGTSGQIEGCIFSSKSGLVAIRCKIAVDCTGDADLASLSGAETRIGRDEDSLTQPATLFFRVRNVDKGELEEYRRENPEPDSMQFSTLVEKARKNGDFPIQREKLGMYEGLRGEWRVNTTRITGIDATNVLDLTQAEIEGRRQVQIVLNFLKKYVPGCANVELIDTAPQIGIRESRRIVGEYVLSADDLLNSRIFDDAIALGGFAIDIHQPDGSSGVFSLMKSGKAYTIPYRCLIPKGLGNVLVAGRCISATHEALGSVRVMPPCFATGQAAGSAAALSVLHDVTIREVNVARLRSSLQDQGGVVE